MNKNNTQECKCHCHNDYEGAGLSNPEIHCKCLPNCEHCNPYYHKSSPPTDTHKEEVVNPEDTVVQSVVKWEEEFDEIGFGNQAMIPGGKYGVKRVELKTFISNLLKSERERIREGVQEMIDHIEILKDIDETGILDGEEQAFLFVLKLIDKEGKG